MVAPICCPSTREAETGGLCSSLVSILAYLLSSRPTRDSVSQTRWMAPEWPLPVRDIHTHTHAIHTDGQRNFGISPDAQQQYALDKPSLKPVFPGGQ